MDQQDSHSESDDFEVLQQHSLQTDKSTFFDGLCQGSKLTEKEKKLRVKIRLQSEQNVNQTTLQQKIQKTGAIKQKRQSFENENGQLIAQEKILIDGNSKQKDNNEKNKQQKQKSFEDLKLIRPLLKAVSEVGYVKPTPIQIMAIPVILSGKDVVASSITGSGKTAAFVLPIMQRYFHAAAVGYIRALIVTPTRQLAIQIHEEFQKLNKFTKLESCLVIGGSSIQRQEQALRNNPEVVITTPGRIIDLIMNSRSVGIENLEMIVFDEADKLLQLGFEAEIKQIMSHVREQVQTILFSATISKEITKLATITSKKPIRVSADPDHKTAERLHQQVIKLKENSDEYREAVLISILSQVYKEKVIVFFKTKRQCHRIAIILGLLGLSACQLHGNLSQTQRIQAFLDFKEGKHEYMLATDLASRGLDIKEVKTVVNFELPVQLTRYIHRIGRTARAGNTGTSVTLCSDNECLELKKMSRKTGDKLFKLNVKDDTIKRTLKEIQQLERDIQEVVNQEREERQIRLAEMQIQKAENMDQHRDEIMSRPRREWFMSENQKKFIQTEAMKDLGLQPLNNKSFEKNKQHDRNGKNQGHNRTDRKSGNDRNFGKDKKFGNDRNFGRDKKSGNDRNFGRDKKSGDDNKFGDDKKFGNDKKREGNTKEAKKERHQSGRNGKFARKTKGIHKSYKK